MERKTPNKKRQRNRQRRATAPAAQEKESTTVITAQKIELVYGDETAPHTRMYPLVPAEAVKDPELWTPSRLSR